MLRCGEGDVFFAGLDLVDLVQASPVEKPCEIQCVKGKPSDEWLGMPDEMNESPDKISERKVGFFTTLVYF